MGAWPILIDEVCMLFDTLLLACQWLTCFLFSLVRRIHAGEAVDPNIYKDASLLPIPLIHIVYISNANGGSVMRIKRKFMLCYEITRMLIDLLRACKLRNFFVKGQLGIKAFPLISGLLIGY